MMTPQTTKALLERYFAGETSLTEERRLAEYFRGGNYPPELSGYAPLFAYWAGQAAQRSPVRPIRRRIRRSWLALAATVTLLLLAIDLLLPGTERAALTDFPVEVRQPIDWSRFEITDEDEAMRIVGGALRRASEGIALTRELTVSELRRTNDIIQSN